MRAEQVKSRRRQQGFMLIEAMVAILIFSLGILGLVALGGQAVGAQSDAQYRTEASGLADAIAGQIAIAVDRTNGGVNIAASLAPFNHRPAGATCVFNGNPTPTLDPLVLALINRAAALPGAGPAQLQIQVQTAPGTFNRVQITLCWKTANDNNAWRQHTFVTYVTGGIN
ncbi:MAG: prepilin-type N-terminal cleavage/methylation domain-containing protein [Pseudomonadota bacterium]|nr:prepilin-type N-terminal cleavage/methylation domain-containing protein [Pseudomonadota bacterium]